MFTGLKAGRTIDLPEDWWSQPGNAGFPELLAINDYLNLGYKLFIDRTVAGDEVDLFCTARKGLRQLRLSEQQNQQERCLGIKNFSQEYPEAKTYLIYQGKREMREGRLRFYPRKL